MNIKKEMFNDCNAISFFQIETETTIGESCKEMFTDIEIEQIDLNKKIMIRNNEGILTLENWDNYKDIFFKQRFSTYKNSYTYAEKLKLELSTLENITTNKADYKILIQRYNSYLVEKQTFSYQKDQEPRKYKSDFYALAYLLDCNAIGESYSYGKKELEKIGLKRVNKAISPNTFYKAVSRILNKDINSEIILIEIAGEDWKEIVFELSKHPEELQKYLQSKQL
jgi:hypothetical protein